jgi:hypothetical protein
MFYNYSFQPPLTILDVKQLGIKNDTKRAQPDDFKIYL